MASEQGPHLNRAEIGLLEVGGRTVESWNEEWREVKKGFQVAHRKLAGLLGIYRATIGGKTMYIGASVEINEGLRKRLRDFSRASDSARNHHGAQKILEHIDDVECDVIVVGNDEAAQGITKELKKLMIRFHDPEWNSDEDVIAERRKESYQKLAPPK